MSREAAKAAGISDAAVKARTGRIWREWFALLDAAGARELNHKAIVALLGKKSRMNGWWQQMVAVAYEQARGLWQKHQKPEGFEISGSKTVAVPVSELFRAWQDGRLRARWLKDHAITIRKATPRKSLRMTWVDGRSHLDVNLDAKGAGKSQVSLQHGKLLSAQEAEKMKSYWKQKLEKLRLLLEG
jgi:uncharacterized protein YndB with AHSA1/START domain